MESRGSAAKGREEEELEMMWSEGTVEGEWKRRMKERRVEGERKRRDEEGGEHREEEERGEEEGDEEEAEEEEEELEHSREGSLHFHGVCLPQVPPVTLVPHSLGLKRQWQGLWSCFLTW